MASAVRPAPALAKDTTSLRLFGGVITLGVPKPADGKHLSLPLVLLQRSKCLPPQLVRPPRRCPNINAGSLPHSWMNNNLILLQNVCAPTFWQVASWEV